jgi:predicted RNase H-like HicB family nuclease
MILNAIIEKDDDGYFAQILELKGCVTQGKTYEEALFNMPRSQALAWECLLSSSA